MNVSALPGTLNFGLKAFLIDSSTDSKEVDSVAYTIT